MTNFQYKQVEAALAETFGITEKGRKAFKARIRNFRNLGVPDLPMVGSGTRNAYTADDIYELYLALELSSFGVNPMAARTVVIYFRLRLPGWCSFVLRNLDDPRYLAFNPTFMGESVDLPKAKGEPMRFERFNLFTREKLLDRHIDAVGPDRRRVIVLNLTAGLQVLTKALEKVSDTTG